MKKLVFSGIVLAFVLVMASCSMKLPFQVGDSQVGYGKVGTATCSQIFSIAISGDCSISTAMAQGGVKRIHHVDQQVQSYGPYQKVTIYVYGE